MKRYRIFTFDFDSRAHTLQPANDDWEDAIKAHHEANRQQAIGNFARQFGEQRLPAKIENFIALQDKPWSIVAYHNAFLDQCRNAFVIGSYYPALTSACALGERILNHLMLNLRDQFKGTPEYKKVYRKDSFDFWPLVIDTLESWGILLPNTVTLFKELNGRRNAALHFNPSTDEEPRDLALEAIHNLQGLIREQFSAFGTQPWFLPVPGQAYIKKEWESHPFIRLVYLPNCVHVGPSHVVTTMFPPTISDGFEYEDREISDDEFVALLTK